MFEKLLATLPYNPGLAQQVAFYSRRMREESSIRRIGMIFIVLAFMVQFFAVINPPKPAHAAACSSNDLVYCGISSPHDAAVACHNNVRGYGAIMDYYGIPCGDLENPSVMHVQKISPNAYNGNLWSLGNNSYGFPDEHSVPINPSNPVVWKHLTDWNIPQPIQVIALNEHGNQYFVMFDCGNLISVGFPQKYTPPAPQTPPEKIGLSPAQPLTKPKPAPAPTPTPTPSPTPTPTPTPCQYDSSITADNISCKPCQESTSTGDTASCIKIHKTASNITAGIADANGTTANPGDVITYTLYAKNDGKATVKDYIFDESMDDVLVYADVSDLHGGTIDADNKVSWPPTFIDPGKTATVQITVKVKDPVPQTPVTNNDPGHYDLVMTNVYGNTVNIGVPGSPQKTVEAATASLPNTGPGTSMLVGAAVVIVAGYFYGRSRLLAKESVLALKENTAA